MPNSHVAPSSPGAPSAPSSPGVPVAPVAPLILPTYAHFAVVAFPAVVHLYTAPVLVFKYISFTSAEVTPEPLNTVPSAFVPVMAVPENH